MDIHRRGLLHSDFTVCLVGFRDGQVPMGSYCFVWFLFCFSGASICWETFKCGKVSHHRLGKTGRAVFPESQTATDPMGKLATGHFTLMALQNWDFPFAIGHYIAFHLYYCLFFFSLKKTGKSKLMICHSSPLWVSWVMEILRQCLRNGSPIYPQNLYDMNQCIF